MIVGLKYRLIKQALMPVTAAALFCCFGPPFARAEVGFDAMPECAAPVNVIEGAICASEESRGLYSNITRKFRDLRQEVTGARLTMLERTHREWFAELVKSCSRTLFWSSQAALVDQVADTLRADCVYLSGEGRLEALNRVTREMLPPAPDLLQDVQIRWGGGFWEQGRADEASPEPILLYRHIVFGFKRPYGHPPDFNNPRAVLESMALSRDMIAKATHLTGQWGPAGVRALDQMMTGYRDCIGAMQNVASTRGNQYSAAYARAQWFVCANGVAEAIRISEPYERQDERRQAG